MTEDARGLTPFDSSLPITRPTDPRDLGWIAKERGTARAQLEAQLGQELDIQGASAALAARTADYHARAIQSMAETQWALDDEQLRKIQGVFVRDHLLPAMQSRMRDNVDAGISQFGYSRRSFDPPPPEPKRRFFGLLEG